MGWPCNGRRSYIYKQPRINLTEKTIELNSHLGSYGAAKATRPHKVTYVRLPAAKKS